MAYENGVEYLRLPAQRRWFGSAFLMVWLALWASGGGKAAAHNTRDPVTLIWLVLWLLGLVATIVMLMGQLVGVDLVRIHRDALVITRRAGPLTRTWRYRTGMIRNLRVDMAQWTGDGLDGAQYVPFTKQRWGTVRFDYGAETIHLAPHVDAPEAAMIIEWLRRRLPVAASL